MAGAIPRFMTAAVLTGHGGPERLELRADVPVPRPGANEVLIRIGAAAINNTDIWTREGRYDTKRGSRDAVGWRGRPVEFPRIQGADIAGTIVAVGPGVEGGRLGERVLVDFVLRQPDDHLFGAGMFGSERDGGFAEYVAAPAENGIAIDSRLSDAELASFPCAYLTAEHMLNRARVSSGERILVSGASGGVGSALVQLAKAREAEVIALVGAGKEAGARSLGADWAIARQTDDLAGAIRSATGRPHVDVYADVVGGSLFAELLPLVRPEGGRYVTAGAIAAPEVTLDLRVLYLNHLELIGSTIGTREEFLRLVRLIEQGTIRPLVAKTYPLTDIHTAQHDFLEKAFFGKLVIVMKRAEGAP